MHSSSSSSASGPRHAALLLFLPAWLALLFYLPTLAYDFVWDDTYFLRDLPYLRDPELWWQAVREPLFVSRNYFRPLPLLMFVGEARLGGPGAFFFHLGNVMLHMLNTLLVVLLARALLPRDSRACWLAAGAGLLFALHPALVENVSWISDRFDLMMALFILLALYAELKVSNIAWRGVYQAACLFAALLCKETGIVLLALLPVWQLFLQARQGQLQLSTRGVVAFWWQRRWLYLSWGGVVLLYLGLRYAALGFLYQSDTQMATGSVLLHLLLIGKTFATYLGLLLFPFGQVSPVHPVQTPMSPGDVSGWLGLVLLAALLLAVCAGLRRGKANTMLVVLALLALAPVSNLLPLTIGDNIAHDRYLIIPIVFVALWLAHLLHAATVAWPRLLALGWTLAAAGGTAMAMPNWENNLTLWAWAYGKHPQSLIASVNYLNALLEVRQNDEAISLAQRLLASDFPRHAKVGVRQSLSVALEREGRLEEAEREIKARLDEPRRDDNAGRYAVSEALNLLAVIQLQQLRADAAERNLREAIRLTPSLPRPHYNLARVFYARGLTHEGDAELQIAVRYAAPAQAAAFLQSVAAESAIQPSSLAPPSALRSAS